MTARIRVGVGGWTFEPWRDNFYPKGWSQARELEYASRKLTAIEINGTYYSSQKPATFAKWRDETPDDFMFSLKASRFATNRRVLAEAGESVERFVNQGIAELAHKLGPRENLAAPRPGQKGACEPRFRAREAAPRPPAQAHR